MPEPAPTPITANAFLSSVAAFFAAWMVVMATRYFALQGGDIDGGLGVGMDTGSWLSTAYAVCEPIGVVIGSWLGIALSLRRMLLIGVVIFMVGSIVPAMVPGYDALMLSRIIMGLAGGVIMPQAIIIQLHAWGPTRVPVALAMFLSAPTAAPQLGGVIGAWGVEHFGWAFVLWAALPPGILALVIGYIGLQRERIQWHPLVHADLAGLAALGGALGFFACAVSQGDRMRWFQTPTIPILFTASALCFAVFALRDWGAVRHPIVWVKLYRRRNVTLSAIGGLPLALAISISGVIVPAALTQLQDFRPEQLAPALWSALWPQALSYPICALILMRKLVEVRAMIIAGVAVVAIGAFFDLQITSQWQAGNLYLGQLIQGVGLPMIAVPLVDIFVASLHPPAESLPAASVLNLSRVLSGTIATAWATTSLRLNGEGKLGEILANTGFYHDGRGAALAAVAARMAHVTSDPMSARAHAVQVIATAAHRQAAVLGVSSTLSTLGWLLFASCLLAVLMAESGSDKVRDAPG
ncbi:MAG TPA: MFS transporter [Steroidobacteraceae bacterium]|jgi:DHA2 family multidrug resistance protein|nr:MFS transporter [Steroidobacteraceae bacterium]